MAFFSQTVRKLKSTCDNLLDDCVVTLFSGKAVHVEGHRGITLFSDNEIILKKRKGVVSILGNNLTITELGESDVYVSGCIEGVINGFKNGGK